MRATNVLLQWAALLGVMSLTSVAGATGNFPGAIQAHLKLTTIPQCSLCHLGGKTGGGTVTTPFGRSARERNMIADDQAVLYGVLDRMAGEQVDSDQDGVDDISELIAGTDPNTSEGDTVGPQTFGCVGRVAGGQGERGGAVLAAALLAVALGRSRRR